MHPMLDFMRCKHSRDPKNTHIVVYPDFVVKRSKHLMIRGGNFYAVFDTESNFWSTDEYEVQRLIDNELDAYAAELPNKTDLPIKVKYMHDFSTGSWTKYRTFLSKLSDQFEQLDSSVIFADTKVVRTDYATRRLDYPLQEGPTTAYEELFGTLYDPSELRKIEWAIGAIISGASVRIQKFFVLFGAPGTGKSTYLKLLELLFEGYTSSFDIRTLVSQSSSFPAESFRNNPLVAIDHEGDLTSANRVGLLNGVVSHDTISMNVKHASAYPIKLRSLLFVATNKPVHISDTKSGIIRRLIDVIPTGTKLGIDRFEELMFQIKFEKSGIAWRCLQVYNELGPSYYERYVPVDMIRRTNVIFNFVEEYRLDFEKEQMITLSRAWLLYKDYTEQASIQFKLQKHQFRDELRFYWREFHDIIRIEGVQYRSLFRDFKAEAYSSSTPTPTAPKPAHWLDLKAQKSLVDYEWGQQQAQLAAPSGYPRLHWVDVPTKLSEIDTTKLHYVIPPANHIVVEFDIRGADGEKSLPLCLEAAKKFPPTYCEVSKSGNGLHLHYIYTGDTTTLSRVYDTNIEVLVPYEKFSVRRKVTMCNDVPIASLSSGLPLKQKRSSSMNKSTIKNERTLRLVLLRALHREIHPNTAPSISFIQKILEEVSESGVVYDVSDMMPSVLDFATQSTNQAAKCISIALTLPYTSIKEDETPSYESESDVIFVDVEIWENLFLVCWKFKGAPAVFRLYNPTPEQVENLFSLKIVGFNNRRYDNHMLYARALGYTNEELYLLNRRIIKDKDRTAYFREAYNLSYTDVHDYSSIKRSLKEWQLELGLPHMEMDASWDIPLPEEMWGLAGDYCANDVESTEKVHEYLSSDWAARLILSELSGLTPNHTTLAHTSRIIFGDEKHPQASFNIPDLSKEFPGYEFVGGKSMYMGEDVGEGGYVHAKPGIYMTPVAYMDIASMHPYSGIAMQIFGKYTPKFLQLVEARVHVKEGEFEKVKGMYNGLLMKYLTGPKADPKGLAHALKIVVNMVYGQTFTPYDNPFRHKDNVENVIAKRGALFMRLLRSELEARGVLAVHYKTDSVKIVDYTEADVEFVVSFAAKYGYTFKIERIFTKMALVNKAELVAKTTTGKWDAVGATFQNPYVYKTLFSKEPLTLKDLSVPHAVKEASMYLDFKHIPKGGRRFIGKVGLFVPMIPEYGGELIRVAKDREGYVSSTKGFYWLEYHQVLESNLEDFIDHSYHRHLVDDAVAKLQTVGDISGFLE